MGPFLLLKRCIMKWKRNDKLIDEPIIDYLEKVIEEELGKGYSLRVSIGTDSQKAEKGTYKFATVILIKTSEDLGGVVVVRGGLIISSTYFHAFKQTNK